MRFLLISSFLILISCKSYPLKNGFDQPTKKVQAVVNPYFSNENKDYVYKASIAVYDKSFGGVFIVKKLAPETHRIVFTTEMGNKIFDFSLYNDEFKINFILEELDKKLLINILKKDFKLLVKENIVTSEKSIQANQTLYKTNVANKKVFYKYVESQLISIHRIGGVSNKEKVNIIFSKKEEDTAKNIQILHQNIQLNITLKAIN